jgi:hypothetical protein
MEEQEGPPWVITCPMVTWHLRIKLYSEIYYPQFFYKAQQRVRESS